MRYLLPGRRELAFHRLVLNHMSVYYLEYYLELDSCHMTKMCNRATAFNFYRTTRLGQWVQPTREQEVLRVLICDVMPVPLRKWCRTLENLDGNGIRLT